MRWVLDVVAIVAVAWWQRARVYQGLRLVTGSRTPGPAPRRQSKGTRLIAVLVSMPDMEGRVRWALSWCATLRFTHTWAELQEVITETQPTAVFADPLADETGDPLGHIERFCREWRVQVILYTRLTPAVASVLLTMGQQGIQHVLFHPFDDADAARIVGVVDWDRVPPPRHDQPPRVA
jgi:hypothetical protein